MSVDIKMRGELLEEGIELDSVAQRVDDAGGMCERSFDRLVRAREEQRKQPWVGAHISDAVTHSAEYARDCRRAAKAWKELMRAKARAQMSDISGGGNSATHHTMRKLK